MLFGPPRTTLHFAVRMLSARFMSAAASSLPLGRRSASSLVDVLSKQLTAIADAGTYKRERVITSPQTASINVSTSSTPVLNFCANNYLGLANHPELVTAAKDALDTHGYGLSSVRSVLL